MFFLNGPRNIRNALEGVFQNLTNAPTQVLPSRESPYMVITDACKFLLGGVLINDGKVVVFESRKLTETMLNYCVPEQEPLAIVYALWVWRCY